MIKNNNLKYTFFILLIFLSNPIISQNDLLGEIDYVNEDYKVGLSAFKAHKIIKKNVKNFRLLFSFIDEI